MHFDKIHENIRTHENVSSIYDGKHPEIYNFYEQERLKGAIKHLVATTGIDQPKVLDYGSGTGNLTIKFLSERCRVSAVDISPKMLGQIRNKALSLDLAENLETVLFDGKQLPLDNDTFDLVSCYSVLHHIPDYLAAIEDMIRVVKPGGFIFIDHELNDNYWFPYPVLVEYMKKTETKPFDLLLHLFRTGELFSLDFARSIFIRLFINKRFKREGDIHVWQDDHIEWDKVRAMINTNKCRIVEENDYLLYHPKVPFDEYTIYAKKCTNIKSILIQKLPS